MKDVLHFWKGSKRAYSSVEQHDKEMRDLTNRLSPGDVEPSEDAVECEGLNSKFEEVDFGRRNAIINRLFEKRKKGQVARQPKNLFLLLLLGFIALGSGCFILFVHPYDILFKLKAVLSDGGEIYEMWRKPEVELYTKIYLFNVSNAEDYLAGRQDKLKLQEIGPYVYRENLEHKNVTFNNNGTLSAVPVHPLTWVEELSGGRREDDIVFMPNIALLSIAHVVSKRDIFTRMGLNTLIGTTGTKALVKMTAKEFMFGYESSLVTLGNSFMPGWIKFDRLGLIDRMYDFEGDFETVFTGEDDVSNSGLLDTYRGSTDLPQWEGKHCSNVQYASDGTKFKSNVQRNESILFYRKSLCRPAPLVPVEEGFKNGLFAYRYTFPDHMLDNGKQIDENKCFCRHGRCLPEGLIDVTECYYGFPIALSYPHFYKGDAVLFHKIEGLSPQQDQHETKFWIQPDAGLPLDVSSKFQINMALDDLSMITNADKFSNLYLPLLWFDICMFNLPDSMNNRFKMYLNVLPVVEQAAMYLLFLTGTVLILISVYRLAFKVMFRSNKHNNIIIGMDMWSDDINDAKNGVYKPCEIPVNREIRVELERRPSGFLKTHADRIKDISIKLNDKVYDSVGSIKDKIRVMPHVKHVFDNEERRSSLIDNMIDNSNTNDGFRSDDDENEYRRVRTISSDDGFRSDGDENEYRRVRTNSSDDECHLEVIDDGSGFDNVVIRSERTRLDVLDADQEEEDLMVSITDLRIDL